nr:MAG TPA: hypothetical protein [Caudoviricetes sp.]
MGCRPIKEATLLKHKQKGMIKQIVPFLCSL